ncbi:hypothetical protein USDA257_c52940 [Sinorhizobium fredii USDA 257]|uniref:Uncharacterized protein n=1 Tax=Sinorhizobium fredii (strain USDA 257) TaxID=1185652 RepID=I3XD62_SINF2|nr:hypothetical protein USDA257_c52940 [Sinorhizobium fredii USDA 257]
MPGSHFRDHCGQTKKAGVDPTFLITFPFASPSVVKGEMGLS